MSTSPLPARNHLSFILFKIKPHLPRPLCVFLVLISCVTTFSAQNVGIGTTTPVAKLDVAGTLKVTDGTQGEGKVLTSADNGLASWQTPPSPKAAFVLATDQTVGNNDFVGVGTISSGFSRNSIVIPFDCELTSITFSIRETVFNSDIEAKVWLQSGMGTPAATTLSAYISDGFVMISSTGTGSVFVSQGDLISVQIDWSSGGALFEGVTASIAYE